MRTIRIALLIAAACLAAPAAAQITSAPGEFAPCGANDRCFQAAIGEFEFNVATIPTVTNAAYAAGQSLGGLITLPIGVNKNFQGVISRIYLESKGGSVVASDIYIWSAKPTATTCTDKTNFVYSQADNKSLVLKGSITPALFAGAQDTSTSGQLATIGGSFSITDGTGNLYICILAHAAVTPASTTDLLISLSGSKQQP